MRPLGSPVILGSISFALVLLAFAACSNEPPAQAPAPIATTTAAKASPPPADPTPPALRLPTTVKPTAYALTMHMSPTEEAISGKVVVDIKVAEPTSVIWMHAGENLNVMSATLGSSGGAGGARIVRGGEEMVGLVFPTTISAGDYKLTVAYDGKLPSRDGRGAYRQEEKGDWYIFTQFESTSARRAFPCFDEPGFKTPYTISIEAPANQQVFSNTPETGTSPSANASGWKTVSFAPSKPLPSYLVAFAVGPFEIVDGGKAGKNQVPVRIIVPKGRSAEAKYAAETTGKIVERLENYFGIPYPYEKVDHIAVPQKGGAMENPGLITYGTTTILGKPEDKSIRLQRGYLGIASHELGHIWFGDYVTTAWWDDIWLNEAFATWISAKIVHEMHPEWEGMVSRVQSRHGVMGNDSLVNARRIRQPIQSKHDIVNAFDGITYQKGGAVIGMFEGWVGEDAFKKGVHEYLNAHAFGNATAAEFLKEVGAHSGHEAEFAGAFQTFLDQPGLPLVTAELSCGNGKTPKLMLTQQRYLPAGSSGSTDESWKIPVCASYPGGKSCTLLAGGSGELELKDAKTCPAWVNPNANGVGYYRVAYKGDMLQKLLKNRALPIHERTSVLGDALALVRAGKMEEGELLGYVPGLVQEGNRHLIGMTIGLVGGLEDKLVPPDLEPNYKRFVSKTYAARANQLGWKPKANEDDSTRLLRPGMAVLVARTDASSPLVAEAKKLADAWLADKKAIDHDLVGNVLAVAAHHSGSDKALWDKLHEAAKKATDRQERNHMLGAMGSFRDPAIVQENFKIVLSDEFDPRDSMGLLFGASNEPKTRQMAWEFMKANFDKLTARMPKDWGSSLVYLGDDFCDADHKADMEAFFKDKVAKLDGGPRTYAQAVETVSLCIAQQPTRQASVTAFLKKQ
jgi:alanyl aminopeptidase